MATFLSVLHTCIISALIANPPPKTTGNKEWQEATKEILRSQNSNPISGISSKPAETNKEDDF